MHVLFKHKDCYACHYIRKIFYQEKHSRNVNNVKKIMHHAQRLKCPRITDIGICILQNYLSGSSTLITWINVYSSTGLIEENITRTVDALFGTRNKLVEEMQEFGACRRTNQILFHVWKSSTSVAMFWTWTDNIFLVLHAWLPRNDVYPCRFSGQYPNLYETSHLNQDQIWANHVGPSWQKK